MAFRTSRRLNLLPLQSSLLVVRMAVSIASAAAALRSSGSASKLSNSARNAPVLILEGSGLGFRVR